MAQPAMMFCRDEHVWKCVRNLKSSSESDAQPEVLKDVTAAVREEALPAAVEGFRVLLGMIRC